MSSAGLIAGAQAGYNVQRGHFVFGLEGDLGYLGISASKSYSSKPSSCTQTYSGGSQTYSGPTGPGNNTPAALCDVDAKYSISSDLYGDLTGRLGYAVDRTLFYAKGWRRTFERRLEGKLFAGQNCKTLGTGALQCGRTIDVQFRATATRLWAGHWSWHRIRSEPLLVAQGRIPALRLRKHVDFV